MAALSRQIQFVKNLAITISIFLPKPSIKLGVGLPQAPIAPQDRDVDARACRPTPFVATALIHATATDPYARKLPRATCPA